MPIDIIAVMTSGVPYASLVYNSYKEKEMDVRLLSFYPVPISYHDFSEDLSEMKRIQKEKSQRKINAYKKGYHDKFEIFKSINCNKCHSPSYDTLKKSWHELILSSQEEVYDISDKIFIENPIIRLSDYADQNRKAIACDDDIFGRNTAISTVFDLFKIGYKEVEFHSWDSHISCLSYVGDLDVFKLNYCQNNPHFIKCDLLKEK